MLDDLLLTTSIVFTEDFAVDSTGSLGSTQNSVINDPGSTTPTDIWAMDKTCPPLVQGSDFRAISSDFSHMIDPCLHQSLL